MKIVFPIRTVARVCAFVDKDMRAIHIRANALMSMNVLTIWRAVGQHAVSIRYVKIYQAAMSVNVRPASMEIPIHCAKNATVSSVSVNHLISLSVAIAYWPVVRMVESVRPEQSVYRYRAESAIVHARKVFGRNWTDRAQTLMNALKVNKHVVTVLNV